MQVKGIMVLLTLLGINYNFYWCVGRGFISYSPCYSIVLMCYNVLQISEGTNSVGIVQRIWAFAYVLLCEVRIINNKTKLE